MLVCLEQRLEELHATELLSDPELYLLEDMIADFLEVKASVKVVTAEVVRADRSAEKLHRLIVLSEGMAANASFARQVRRKFLRASEEGH